jgi:hypothetical protein
VKHCYDKNKNRIEILIALNLKVEEAKIYDELSRRAREQEPYSEDKRRREER